MASSLPSPAINPPKSAIDPAGASCAPRRLGLALGLFKHAPAPPLRPQPNATTHFAPILSSSPEFEDLCRHPKLLQPSIPPPSSPLCQFRPHLRHRFVVSFLVRALSRPKNHQSSLAVVALTPPPLNPSPPAIPLCSAALTPLFPGSAAISPQEGLGARAAKRDGDNPDPTLMVMTSSRMT